MGLEDPLPGVFGRPSRSRSWKITIIAPMPHEKPETTACGTLATCRPSLRTQKIIRKIEAARQTFAAPPIPWVSTVPLMNGTVTLDVPPIRTGLRPNTAVIGAVRIDVKRPNSAGRPISRASARP